MTQSDGKDCPRYTRVMLTTMKVPIVTRIASRKLKSFRTESYWFQLLHVSTTNIKVVADTSVRDGNELDSALNSCSDRGGSYWPGRLRCRKRLKDWVIRTLRISTLFRSRVGASYWYRDRPRIVTMMTSIWNTTTKVKLKSRKPLT